MTLSNFTMAHVIDAESDTPSPSTTDKDALNAQRNKKNNKINSMIEWLKTFRKFVGPGYMIAVGYLDPGNWATDLSAGSLVSADILIIVQL